LEGISDLAGIFLGAAQLYRDVAEASRAKDEFLATLSHELRNPLGAIANAVTALDHAGTQSEAGARLRHIIHRQHQRPAAPGDHLLDVARLTAGKVALTRQPTDLSEVAGHAVRAVRESGRARDRRVTLRAESVVVNADPARLEQIVANLLDNAVKFTPAGGCV